MAQSREGGVITAHWEADTAILGVYVSISVVHSLGEVTLQVAAWSEGGDAAEEDMAYWRRLVLDELDALWLDHRQRTRRRR